MCAGPPSGPLSRSLGTFSGLCSLGSAAAPHRPAANQGKSSDKPDSILAASVRGGNKGTFPFRLGTSLAVAAGTVVPPQRAGGRPGRSETHAKALWGTLKGTPKAPIEPPPAPSAGPRPPTCTHRGAKSDSRRDVTDQVRACVRGVASVCDRTLLWGHFGSDGTPRGTPPP